MKCSRTKCSQPAYRKQAKRVSYILYKNISLPSRAHSYMCQHCMYWDIAVIVCNVIISLLVRFTPTQPYVYSWNACGKLFSKIINFIQIPSCRCYYIIMLLHYQTTEITIYFYTTTNFNLYCRCYNVFMLFRYLTTEVTINLYPTINCYLFITHIYIYWLTW